MVSRRAVILSRWYARHPITEHGVELPRTMIRRAHSMKKRKYCTISLPDSFRVAVARRNILNAVRVMIVTSDINGIAKTAEDPLSVGEISSDRHTPDNGSYTNSSAESLEALFPRFQWEQTHCRTP